MSAWEGIKTYPNIPTGDKRRSMRTFEIHMPYPDDSVLTDDAVAHLVGQDLNIDRDGDLIPGTIVKAVNLPAERAYRITIEEDEESRMEPIRKNVFDQQQ